MKEIKGLIKNYDWGTTDFIPSVLGIKADGKPNAEYWLSTEEVLFKIISIAKPLSVQCHPSDEQAVKGFSEGNPNYSSPHGKPEAICALTNLKMRCGVKPGITKEQFISVLNNHQKNLDGVLDDYMNVLTLKPGQAVYIKPGTIHQYIEGNGMEIMCFSDNVIRGGMTSKRVDLNELSKIADFSSSAVETLQLTKDARGVSIYNIPCSKFSLKTADCGHFDFIENKDALLLFMSGSKKGQSFFIPAGEKFSIDSDGKFFIAC